MNDLILSASHVCKRFATHTALDDVSIDVQRGHIFGLLGHNGAGKTTLIRIINHITAPDSGTVTFDGHPLTQNDVARIGYLPEERGLYKKMKVGEQAVYLAQLKGLSAREAKSRLQAWFEKLDITDWWNKRLEELSKGMQQKVQFITTVVHRPPAKSSNSATPVTPSSSPPTIWRASKNSATTSPSSATLAWYSAAK